MQKIIANKKLNLLQSSFLPNANDSNALWNRNADVTFQAVLLFWDCWSYHSHNNDGRQTDRQVYTAQVH